MKWGESWRVFEIQRKRRCAADCECFQWKERPAPLIFERLTSTRRYTPSCLIWKESCHFYSADYFIPRAAMRVGHQPISSPLFSLTSQIPHLSAQLKSKKKKVIGPQILPPMVTRATFAFLCPIYCGPYLV